MPANVSLGFIFGALVGALFLAVLLVITVWQYTPIAGAGIVSMVPLATLGARPIASRLPRLLSICGGAVLLAGGLAGLALLPSSSLVYVMISLALCGFGLGLSVPFLTHASLSEEAGLTRSGTLTIGIRHLGLVLALALIAPILANQLPAAGDRAELKATAVIIDAPIGLDKKIPLALDLKDAFGLAQEGAIPDLAAPFDKRGAKTDPKLASVRDSLIETIRATITRAFRPAFWVSALLALLAIVPVLAVPPPGEPVRKHWAGIAALCALLALAGGLIAVELSNGAVDYGKQTVANPCKPRAPFPGSGFDATLQRIVLNGLDGAACSLHTTREEFVLAFAPDQTGVAPIKWDRATIEKALRAGLTRSVDDAERRGDIGGLVATILHKIVENAPLDWLINGGSRIADLLNLGSS